MIKLAPVAEAEPKYHEELLATMRPPMKEDGLLLALEARFTAYDKGLETRFVEPLTSTPLFLKERETRLKKLYDSKARVAIDHRDGIRAIERRLCPYCGYNSPNTLDHFLPKDIYPEFSMYGKNLIPACGDCNNRKGVNVWKDGQRQFINPYCDAFLVEECVHLSIIPDPVREYEIPLFEFDFFWNDCTPEEQNIFRAHFAHLEVGENLSRHITTEYFVICDRYTNNGPRDLEGVKDDLECWRRSRRTKAGPNSWEFMLYDAILKNWDLLQYLAASNP